MKLALDYDDTYTADPELWLSFIDAATARGHEVICVTARKDSNGMDAAFLGKVKVICTNGQPKIDHVEHEYPSVSVWIDDAPHLIYKEGQVELPVWA